MAPSASLTSVQTTYRTSSPHKLLFIFLEIFICISFSRRRVYLGKGKYSFLWTRSPPISCIVQKPYMHQGSFPSLLTKSYLTDFKTKNGFCQSKQDDQSRHRTQISSRLHKLFTSNLHFSMCFRTTKKFGILALTHSDREKKQRKIHQFG